ncbi:hypothetical protein SH528x_004958 [Novipirellula sp. SH528]|uniref:hypothetical protein n=1 Tax=Novipirellula sp. SH528 TaxID=3454466 RepID=UPI003FA14E5F
MTTKLFNGGCVQILLASAVAILTAQGTKADGLFYKLPADGASATYEMKALVPNVPAEHAQTVSVKLSSVGTTEAKGARGRWIEIAQVANKERKAFKILVLEKDLTRDFSQHHVMEAWRQRGSSNPLRVKEIRSEIASDLNFMLSKKLSNVQKLDPIEIETPLGKLKCSSISGSFEFSSGRVLNRVKTIANLNRESPFGVVRAVMDVQAVVDDVVQGEFQLQFKLIKIEAGAKSEIDHETAARNPGPVVEAAPHQP